MENDNLNQLGDKILELRRKKHISQEDFAKRIGVSRQVVSKWESNVVLPKLEKLQLISNVFGIDVEQLMSEDMSAADLVVDVSEDVNENLIEEDINEKLRDTADEPKGKYQKRLSKRTKKLISACVVLLLVGIALIVFDYLTTPKMEEGDFEIIVAREWNFSVENIGWIFFGVASGLSVIWGISLIFYIIKRKIKIKRLAKQNNIDKEDFNQIGNKILTLRKNKRITQEEFANKVGVSRQSVSKWEAGEVQPRPDKLQIISNILGVELDYLMPQKCDAEDSGKTEDGQTECNKSSQNSLNKSKPQYKANLSKKSKIKIAVVSTLYVLGIALIVFAYATAPSEMEGSFGGVVTSTSWNFSAENIGWIIFSLALTAGIVMGIILLCKNVKKRHANKSKTLK